MKKRRIFAAIFAAMFTIYSVSGFTFADPAQSHHHGQACFGADKQYYTGNCTQGDLTCTAESHTIAHVCDGVSCEAETCDLVGTETTAHEASCYAMDCEAFPFFSATFVDPTGENENVTKNIVPALQNENVRGDVYPPDFGSAWRLDTAKVGQLFDLTQLDQDGLVFVAESGVATMAGEDWVGMLPLPQEADKFAYTDAEYANPMGLLKTVLNNFGMFSFGDISLNVHVAQPVVANGNCTSTTGGISIGNGTIKGNKATFVNGSFVDSLSSTAGTLLNVGDKFYVNEEKNPSTSLGIAEENNNRTKWVYKPATLGTEKTLITTLPIYHSKDYIDFTLANSAFTQARQTISTYAGKTITLSDLSSNTLPAGVTYNANTKQLNVTVGNHVALNKNLYAPVDDTGQKNYPINCININDPQNRIGELLTTITILDEEFLKLCTVSYNGTPYNYANNVLPGGDNASYCGVSMGLIWNVPNATKISLADQSFGHLLAPQATIVTEHMWGGAFDGAVIGRSVNLSRLVECHYWGFAPGFPTDPTPTPEKGSLTIRKTFAGDTVTAPTGLKFTVTKEGDTTFNKEIPYNDPGFKIVDGKTYKEYTLTDLDFGTYTVTESGSDVKDHTVVTTYEVIGNASSGSTTPVAATIAANNDKATISVTNTYTKDKGSLVLRKTFAGASVTPPATLKFTLTSDEDPTFTKTVFYNDAAFEQVSGQNYKEYTFKDLPLGTYTVTEEGGAVNGYTVTTKYVLSDGSEKNSATIVNKGDKPIIHATNTYKKVTNAFVIEKVFAGDPVTPPSDLLFTITSDVADFETITIKYSAFNGGTKHTLENLDPGAYTVTESSASIPGYSLTTKYELYNGNTLTGTPSEASMTATVTSVANAPTPTVKVTNTYEKISGDLIIRKVFSGNTVTPPATLQFRVTSSVPGFTLAQNPIPYTAFTNVNGVREYKITGLAPGTYRVTEENAAVPGQNVSTTYQVIGTGSGNEGIIQKTGDAPVVVITNNYTTPGGPVSPPDPNPDPDPNPTPDPDPEPGPDPDPDPTDPTDPEDPTTDIPDRPSPTTPPNPTTPGRTVVPTDTGTYLEIGDDGVPLGEWVWDDAEEDWVFIPEPDVPLASAVPETGDHTNPMGMLVLGLGGLMIGGLAYKKKEN